MLSIQNLNKEYPDKTVFHNYSVTIPKGVIISLNGINGIGKTTLLNILGGVTTFEGDISMNGFDLKKDFLAYMEITSLVPNSPFLYEYLTVSEMIDMVNTMSKTNNKLIIQELFAKLKLSGFESVLIKNLSLGTRQKVAFIIAFIHYPKLILIDEPFVNFDRASLKNLLSFLQDYVKKNEAIIIFSTHTIDPDIQGIITHKLEIMNEKRIIFNRKNESHVEI
ncbi:ABC transporter ATP-binding protein [Virgibacillus dokdonensis]|nr:ABC transporter ATP-binding protein [Virgibacillus dokdonensis]